MEKTTPRSARRTPCSGSRRDLALPPGPGLGSSRAVAPAQSSSHSASHWLTAPPPRALAFAPMAAVLPGCPPPLGRPLILLCWLTLLVQTQRWWPEGAHPPLESGLSCLTYSRPPASRTIRLPTTPRVSASSNSLWGLRPTPSGGWFSHLSCHRAGHPTLPSWILPFPS